MTWDGEREVTQILVVIIYLSFRLICIDIYKSVLSANLSRFLYEKSRFQTLA